ncbi:MAG: hypothetical protein WC289_03060 [Patescibacteria group bacterium]|jgi:hypothetical protein
MRFIRTIVVIATGLSLFALAAAVFISDGIGLVQYMWLPIISCGIFAACTKPNEESRKKWTSVIMFTGIVTGAGYLLIYNYYSTAKYPEHWEVGLATLIICITLGIINAYYHKLEDTLIEKEAEALIKEYEQNTL